MHIDPEFDRENWKRRGEEIQRQIARSDLRARKRERFFQGALYIVLIALGLFIIYLWQKFFR